ncbi:uncharacterized protein MAM_04047 [Metarhizium album ARSEF 1941]|uniref:Pentatricopeptide repeat domain-containing protein n=1 Tax=Metarhizium album (strain ARSEF 1941) TaxID=1081103 RepID=A0A0B2WQG6_METAS|nr:uncharacterized protein MAM_04047 [Metarhizium album ARSEF 1941]KHN98286.1 hypothetical protein MAM_04047 [Metarhizium album ARSEF 1941]
MQSLWTRAGQARRCGCRTCSTAIRAAGARAAGAAGRRKATFAEIFTACYSSVFATAAIVDAVRKDDRRRELDRQLEEARRELSELQDRSPPASPNVGANASNLSIQQMDTLWKSLKDIYRNRPFMKEIDKPAMIDASELITNLKESYYYAPGEPLRSPPRQIDYDQLEKAIMAEEQDSRISSRESLNQEQLIRESESAENLVQQLLRRAEALDDGSAVCPTFDEVIGLAAKGYPNFSFRSIDPEMASKNTVVLNRQIRSLVNAKDLSWKEKIGRVCFNLLVSPHPPDMHTYNTLIVAFDRLGCHLFSDALVYSFFHRRLLKPTPSTFMAILNHYILTRNHGLFLRTLACLTGLEGKYGAKMGRRHVEDIEDWGMERWAANTKLRTSTGRWVWEHVPLNLPLVETILNGLLHFKLFDDAASLFVSCMRCGVALSTRAVKQLFDECIAALDWKAAVRLIRGLSESRKWREIFLLQEDIGAAAHLLGRVFALVDLCGFSSYRERVDTRRLISLGISEVNLKRLLRLLLKANLRLPEAYVQPGSVQVAHTRGGDEMTRSKSRLLQLESILKEYEFVRKTTHSIESKLLYPEFSPRFRASMAVHIGASAIQRSVLLAGEVQHIVPPSESLSLQSPQTGRNVQPAQEESLVEEMETMALNDEWTGQQGGPRRGQAQTALATATGGRRKQDGPVSEHVCVEPRGLLAWQRPPNRVYAAGRQWIVGT